MLSGAALTAPAVVACAGTDKVPTDGVPRSAFDDQSTAEDVTAGIDLSDKTAPALDFVGPGTRARRCSSDLNTGEEADYDLARDLEEALHPRAPERRPEGLGLLDRPPGPSPCRSS